MANTQGRRELVRQYANQFADNPNAAVKSASAAFPEFSTHLQTGLKKHTLTYSFRSAIHHCIG
jgi:hypothetical protein